VQDSRHRFGAKFWIAADFGRGWTGLESSASALIFCHDGTCSHVPLCQKKNEPRRLRIARFSFAT
jgi:hypothetical protein